LETVKVLLDVPGVDVNAPGYRGATALYEAAGRGHEKTVQLLLEKGADPNVKGAADSVLMAAVKARQTGIVKMLMAAGAKK
jgi:uncharacterized protein